MRVLTWVILLLLVFGASLGVGIAARQWHANSVRTVNGPSPAARGAMLYNLQCARCHGDEGHGDAEGADKLVPPPRDFASRPWRFAPTAASIQQTITKGIPGTSMPAFGATMTASDIASLTEYVLALSQAAPTQAGASNPFSAAKFFPLATPRQAPSLRLESVGEPLALDDLRGKVVLVNFWGTACEHCLARMPQLAELQQRMEGRDFAIVNVCADEGDAAVAQAMLTTVAPSLISYVDPTGLANSRYEVSLMPTIWLLNREGQLVGKAQGARDWNDPALATLLEVLLAP